MADVVVVGAGMGGLAAATRLSTLGHSVTLCEQANSAGGKLGTYARDGFVFDTGPSLLTLPAVYRDLFRSTGEPLETVVDLQPVDPVCRYRFADGTRLDLPNASRPGIAAALDDALGAGAGGQWTALIDRAAAMWRATRVPFLESAQGRGALLRMAARPADVRTVAPWQTLRGLGQKYLRDPRLRMLFERYATYTGSDPRHAPAALAVIPYIEQTFGAWQVRGGMRRLGDALRDRAEERGVRLLTGADVTRIHVTAGRAAGVRLADGGSLQADVVVANADAAEVYGRLLPSSRQLHALHKATPSMAGFVLLLALRGRTPDGVRHRVLFPADYDAEFDAVFGRSAAPVADPTVYICSPDDPATRPDEDHESWFVLVNAPRHGSGPGAVDWHAPGVRDAYAATVLAVMAARGLDVRERLLWSVVRTPADLALETRAPGGAIYGSSSNGRRAAFRRPANRSPVPGLFLVGGSTHPGGGLPLVGLSAAIVADLVGPA